MERLMDGPIQFEVTPTPSSTPNSTTVSPTHFYIDLFSTGRITLSPPPVLSKHSSDALAPNTWSRRHLITIKISDRDLLAVSIGERVPVKLFSEGRLRVKVTPHHYRIRKPVFTDVPFGHRETSIRRSFWGNSSQSPVPRSTHPPTQIPQHMICIPSTLLNDRSRGPIPRRRFLLGMSKRDMGGVILKGQGCRDRVRLLGVLSGVLARWVKAWWQGRSFRGVRIALGIVRRVGSRFRSCGCIWIERMLGICGVI